MRAAERSSIAAAVVAAVSGATIATIAPVAPTATSAAASTQVTVLHAGQTLAHARVRYTTGQVALIAAFAVRATLAPGERPAVALEEVPQRLSGPLPAGYAAGHAVVRVRGRVLADVPLVTAAALPRATAGQRLSDYFSRGLTLALLAVLVGCSLLLAILQRRVSRRSRLVVGREPQSR